jgi:hypothetical protein
MSAFSLTIHVLGPTPTEGSNFGPNNKPDYIKLEQYYLDSYTLAYNVNRYASGPYKLTRRQYTFYLYSTIDFNLIQVFFSASKLSAFIPDVSKNFGTDVAKMIDNLGVLAICYNSYIISMVELDLAFLKANLSSFPVKPVSTLKLGKGSTI